MPSRAVATARAETVCAVISPPKSDSDCTSADALASAAPSLELADALPVTAPLVTAEPSAG